MENQISEEIKIFIDSLLLQKGLHQAPDSVKEQLILEIYDRLQQWLLADMFNAVPDSAEQQLEQFMSGDPSKQQIQEFFEKIIPNHEEVLSNSLRSFEQTYLG
jgi:hypothetical protein